MDVPIAANVLGTIGAVCWSIQVHHSLHPSLLQQAFSFQLPRQITPSLELTLTTLKLIPQIIINYRRHNTVGLQRSMMLLWACAGVPLGAYNISENFNIALQIQPQILTVLSLITWIQCYHYDDVSSGPRFKGWKAKILPHRDRIIVIDADMDQKWSPLKCCAVVGVIGAIFGGVETGLVFALKVCCFHVSLTVSQLTPIQAALREDRHWPITLMGVVSTVLLSAGVLRHYYDIYVHRTVRGISFIFVGIDAAGDVFSLISVCEFSLLSTVRIFLRLTFQQSSNPSSISSV